MSYDTVMLALHAALSAAVVALWVKTWRLQKLLLKCMETKGGLSDKDLHSLDR